MSDGNNLLADYLTEQKLAESLKCHPRTPARWRARRIGPRYTLNGRQILYHVEDVRQWLRAGGLAAPAPTPQRRERARAR